MGLRESEGKIQLTDLPALLLWTLIFDCRSSTCSRTSRNFLEKSIPKARLWEQPLHSHLFTLALPLSWVVRYPRGSQPQDMRRPWAHARATECATPAAVRAYRKAASRKPILKIIYSINCSSIYIPLYKKKMCKNWIYRIF